VIAVLGAEVCATTVASKMAITMSGSGSRTPAAGTQIPAVALRNGESSSGHPRRIDPDRRPRWDPAHSDRSFAHVERHRHSRAVTGGSLPRPMSRARVTRSTSGTRRLDPHSAPELDLRGHLHSQRARSWPCVCTGAGLVDHLSPLENGFDRLSFAHRLAV